MKKRGFIVDRVSEDSFFENLLLGIVKILKESPFITNLQLGNPSPPVSQLKIQYWEYINGVYLPEDLKDFYLSTNGFNLEYKFAYYERSKNKTKHEDTNEITGGPLKGGINVNNIEKLQQIPLDQIEFPVEKMLAPTSKIFTIFKIDDHLEIVMIYFDVRSTPSYWLYWISKNFYFLADTFKTYFRMALAHLGLPGWHLAFIDGETPEWCTEMVNIANPRLLECNKDDDIIYEDEINVIDPNIFKIEKTRIPDGSNLSLSSTVEEKSKAVAKVSEKFKFSKVKNFIKINKNVKL